MKLTYKNTLVSCFIGYIVQAITINFIPLLFITFQNSYQIPLSQITLLVTVNFTVQLLIDITAPLYVDKLGYRPCIVAAHVFSASGLLLLTVLPEVLSPFTGLLLSVVIYAIGSGLIEVLISPITDSCPTENKEKAMKVLKSRLYDLYRAEKDAAYAQSRKAQVGSGERNERIRTYNFPQGRVTDHRVGLTLYKIDSILDGEMDEIIDALIMDEQAAKLKQLSL